MQDQRGPGINPHSNVNGRQIGWDQRRIDANNAGYLELADVALRPEKSEPQKANASVKSDDIAP